MWYHQIKVPIFGKTKLVMSLQKIYLHAAARQLKKCNKCKFFIESGRREFCCKIHVFEISYLEQSISNHRNELTLFFQ